METMEKYWDVRLKSLQQALEANNFSACTVQTVQEAEEYVMGTVLPASAPTSVSFGGSTTFMKTGLAASLETLSDVQVILPNASGLSDEERFLLHRRGLMVDLYLTGTNAITETGVLVNLDMIGNRVAALSFGPKKVVVLVGRNKIVPDLEAAMRRIRDYVAPANAIRLDCKTPCVKTAKCTDCQAPDRICNTWVITEKSFPKQRITVVLINQDIGL